jgi:pyrimidine operon attenuation protein/uracil phosphoribosyltransferase
LEIDKVIYRLSKEITESEFSNPLLIGIPRRDDLEKEVEKNYLTINPQDRDVVLIDDVIYTGRTLRASIESVMFSGRPKQISLLCLVDRGHRELPITPKFIGKNIPTNEKEYVSVFLKEIDDEDKVEVG